MGLAAIYSRSDINIRVAPPLLDLNDVVEKFTNMGNYVVGIYLAKDVEEIANKIESMNRIGSIGIFRIYA
jgi:hypothetical protein